MKLEFKQFAQLAIHGVQIIDMNAPKPKKTIITCEPDTLYECWLRVSQGGWKMMVRPLSDLEEIDSIRNVFEHEGIAIDDFTEEGTRFFLDGESVWCKCDQLPYYVMELMIEQHFNVFGLDQDVIVSIDEVNK